MEVTFKCPHCNTPYKAPDHLIGRRIKCRHCGKAVTIEKPSEEAGAGPAEKICNTVYGSLIDPLDIAESMASPSHRTNQPLRYPLAPWIDEYGPWALSAFGSLWIWIVAMKAEGSEGWIEFTRAIFALLGFVIVVWPISHFGLVKGMDKARLGLPPRHLPRSFACFSPPYAFAYFVWAKTGSATSVGIGALLGLLIALGFVRIFFRLQMRDLLPSLGLGSAGFLVSVAMAAGAMFGINLTVVSIVNFYKVSDAPAFSPIAPKLAWNIVRKAPPTTREVKPTVIPAPRAVSLLSSDSPRVEMIEVPAFDSFDEIIHPLVESNFAALVNRNAPEEDTVQLADLKSRKVMAEAKFKHEAGVRDRYILSPKGEFLAKIVSWPKLSAQVWSFADGRIRNVDLTSQNALGAPELTGFISPDVFMATWRRAGVSTATMIPINVRTGEFFTSLAKNIPAEENASPAMAFSADGKKLAAAVKTGGAALLIYDLTATGSAPTASLKITALDPRWAILPSGLSFSPDGTRAAMFYEHGDNALLLCWDVVRNEQTIEQIYPSNPAPGSDASRFAGGTLKWLGKDEWILYGQTLIAADASQHYDPLMLYPGSRASRARIAHQHAIDRFNFALAFESPDGRKMLAFVKLVDPSKPVEASTPEPEK